VVASLLYLCEGPEPSFETSYHLWGSLFYVHNVVNNYAFSGKSRPNIRAKLFLIANNMVNFSHMLEYVWIYLRCATGDYYLDIWVLFARFPYGLLYLPNSFRSNRAGIENHA
jgi:hypothetical protein